MSTASSVNMRSILGVLMVLAVSADGVVDIPGIVGKDVLLPCYCPDINTGREFKWQLESDVPVFIINQSHTDGRYKSRAEIFDDRENSSNCSLHLRYLNAKDTGKYECRFYQGETYQHESMNLNVIEETTTQRNHNFSGSTDKYQGQPNCPIRFLKIIPIVLLLGVCLYLWCRRERVSH